LKPENILLDYNMNPKIADFGSARALSSNRAEERTSQVVGTWYELPDVSIFTDSIICIQMLISFVSLSGYKAPEYASRGVYSLKTDVFSFGILVLVIISGRKNTILDKRGDTIGDLVRDVSELDIYFKQDMHCVYIYYKFGFAL
jgi:interleukin-1 receptor-associated kinase 1